MQKLNERTYAFSLRVLKMASSLPHRPEAQVLQRQVVRSGTSIGANVEEAYGTGTQPDFAHRLMIALREARETHYWLRLIKDSGIVPAERMEPLIKEAQEIKLILGKSVITSRKGRRRSEEAG